MANLQGKVAIVLGAAGHDNMGQVIARRFAGDNLLGISAARPAIDLGRTVAWKDGIVRRLNTGVTGLLKRARVKTVAGRARFRDGRRIVAHAIGRDRLAERPPGHRAPPPRAAYSLAPPGRCCSADESVSGWPVSPSGVVSVILG